MTYHFLESLSKTEIITRTLINSNGEIKMHNSHGIDRFTFGNRKETKFDIFCRVLSDLIPWALVAITIAGALYKFIIN